VEDDGVGIPAEQLPHVFERFWRGDPARHRVDGEGQGGGSDGAGLGLAIARWIADAHGGDVRLERAANGGTIARVSLPSPAHATHVIGATGTRT
jgi:signal transduction histidine kinase